MSSSTTPSPNSAQLHMPLPSPPAFQHRTSRRRLHLPTHPHEPPVPPRLVGSELLRKVTHPEPHHQNYSEVWLDGDEFGTRRASSQSPMSSPALTVSSLSPGTPPTSIRGSRRMQSVTLPKRARSHSPPPTPHFAYHEPALTHFPFPEQLLPGTVPTHVIHEAVHASIPELDLSSSWSWSPSSKSNVWNRDDPSRFACKA